MKRTTFYTLLTALLALWTTAAWAGAPDSVNFQGRLRDGSGNPVTVATNVAYRIYDVPVGGATLWGPETHNVTPDAGGLYNVTLGSLVSFPSNLFAGTPRYLGITIAADPEVTPRTQIVSVAYALRVKTVDGATGGEIFGDLQLHSTLIVGDLAGDVGRIEVTDGAANTIIADGPNGKVSAASVGAGNRLAIEGTARSLGASTATAVSGLGDASGSGDAIGGFFKTTASGTGNHYGLRSEVDATSGTAIAYGLFSKNNSTTPTIHYGVVGQALGVGSVQNRAIEGVASGATGLNIGIRGDASGTGAYAGSFENAKVRVGATGAETIVDGNGDLFVQDEMEVDGVATFSAGTAAAPALTFAGDLNSGIFQPVADALSLATLGSERIRVNSAGDVGVGTTAPGSRLHIREDINGAAALIIENPNAGTSSLQRIEFNSEDGSGTSTGAFISVFDNGFPGIPNGMRIGNNLTAGDIDFLTSGAVRLILESGGNVAIGTTAPAEGRLDVNRSAAQVVNVNRTTTDGILINFEQDDAFVGDISVAGAIVSYNAFTGSHYGWTEEVLERGALVALTGINRNAHDNPKSEVIYGIKRSSVANDPACLGSYLALQEPAQPASSENPHLVMAVGNGDMWVVDEGGDIQPGDFLISSSVSGHAMKDDPDKYPLGYVIARAAEPVNWTSENEMVGGRKHKRFSVLFESFVRTGTTQLTKIIEHQQKEIEELKTLVKTLMADHPLGKKQFGELEQKGIDK